MPTAKIVSSAGAALEKILEAPPDILVSDIGMPGEDGYSLIRRVRALPEPHLARAIAAIALTAYARTEDQRNAIAAGFDRHVAKPIDPTELVETVAAVAAKRRG